MKYRYDPAVPLALQLAEIALASPDVTTEGMFVVVRDGLNQRIENYYRYPNNDNLLELIGYWSRAIRLLEATPMPTASASERHQ